MKALGLLFDKTVEHVLQLGRIVRSVDYVALVLEIELSLGSQFTSKVLGTVCQKKLNVYNKVQNPSHTIVLTSWRPSQSPGDVDHVRDDGLDSVALALYFGDQPRHLVPVERVLYGSIDVQRHLSTFISSTRLESMFPANSIHSPRVCSFIAASLMCEFSLLVVR